MKKMREVLLYSLCSVMFFLSYSCRNEERRDITAGALNTYMVGERNDSIKVSDISKEATAIPLDSTVFLGLVHKMVNSGDSVFLLGDRGVYLFDLQDGRQKNCYEKKGRSRNEYARIKDFDVDSVSGKIYLLCDPEKIIELTPDFQFSRSIETQGDYERLAVVDGRIYLYSYYLHKLDVLQGDTTALLMDIPETRAWVYGESTIFHKTDAGLLFTPEPFSTIFAINGNEIKNLIHLSYPNERETMERMTKSKLEKEELFEYPFPKIAKVVVTDSIMMVTYSYAIALRVCLIDRNNHKVIADGCQNYILPKIGVHGSLIGEFIYYHDEDMGGFLDNANVKYTFVSQPAKETDQHVILKYKPLP